MNFQSGQLNKSSDSVSDERSGVMYLDAKWLRVSESAEWLADGSMVFMSLAGAILNRKDWQVFGYSDGRRRNLGWDGTREALVQIFDDYLRPDGSVSDVEFSPSGLSEFTCRAEGGTQEVAGRRRLRHRFGVDIREGIVADASWHQDLVKAAVRAWDPAYVVITDSELFEIEDRSSIWQFRPGYIVWISDLFAGFEKVDPTLPVSVEEVGGGTMLIPEETLSPAGVLEVESKLFDDNGVEALPREDVLQAMDAPLRGEVPSAVGASESLDQDTDPGDITAPAESYREQISGWMLSPEGDVPLWVQPDQSSGVPVRFVGRTQRGDTEVFLHAIYGVDRFGDPSDQLAVRSAAKLLSIATWQLEVLPEGAVLEWHTDTASAATGLRNFLAIHGLTAIRVVHTPQVGGDL